ncbi:MAG: class I SAM-dependent methyltransferase [Methermicoccaceae archaeon]
MNKLTLAPTAALVIRWAMEMYTEEPVASFIEGLDLSSADEMLARADRICDWYGESILNRKYFMKNAILELLKTSDEPCQVVIMAAGKSPLSLEVLLKSPDRISRIFEVDVVGMDEKKVLYDDVAPSFAEKIRCITSDITSDSMYHLLQDAQNGYDPSFPTIISMEGISFYLTSDELKTLFEKFSSPPTGSKRNAFVVEYLLPYDRIHESVRHIPQGIFDLIEDECELDWTKRYTLEEISALFESVGGEAVANHSFEDIERARTGKNTYFKAPASGWKGYFVGRI